MNKAVLESKMKLFGDNQSKLAEAMGISLQRFNAKVNQTDGAQFTQGEIKFMIIRYNLNCVEIYVIFFGGDVSLLDTNGKV